MSPWVDCDTVWYLNILWKCKISGAACWNFSKGSKDLNARRLEQDAPVAIPWISLATIAYECTRKEWDSAHHGHHYPFSGQMRLICGTWKEILEPLLTHSVLMMGIISSKEMIQRHFLGGRGSCCSYHLGINHFGFIPGNTFSMENDWEAPGYGYYKRKIMLELQFSSRAVFHKELVLVYRTNSLLLLAALLTNKPV